MFQQLLQEDFRMLQVVSTGAYYPPVDTTWKILTTGASQLTAGPLCIETKMGQICQRKLFQIESLVGSQGILLFGGDSSQQRMGVFQSEPKLTNFVQKNHY